MLALSMSIDLKQIKLNGIEMHDEQAGELVHMLIRGVPFIIFKDFRNIMIYGIGTDIVDNERIKRSKEKFGDRFLKKIYSEKELLYAKGRKTGDLSLCARFAGKEAFVKALGTGFSGSVAWNDISILNQKSGKPYIKLSGSVKKIVDEVGIKFMDISLSHIDSTSIAVVILEK